jgi:dihydrofolate reductase
MIEKILIAAIDKDGGIGKDGYMPWHYPEDLKLFMRLTIGNTVIMGRKTFDGMFARGHAPLKQRQNIIVTSQVAEYRSRFAPQYPPSQLDFVPDLDRTDLDGKVFYCGGAEIYRQAIEFVDIIYLTRLLESYTCDTFFPHASTSTTTEFIPYIPSHLKLATVERVAAKQPFNFCTYIRD